MDDKTLIERLRMLIELYDESQAERESIEEDGRDSFYDLKVCAWNVLHENPGCDFGVWECRLIEEYPSEVVDALGSNAFDVYPALADLWDCYDFEDPDTGECHTFANWAEFFATDRSVELYDMLVDARREIKRLQALKFLK